MPSPPPAVKGQDTTGLAFWQEPTFSGKAGLSCTDIPERNVCQVALMPC